MTTLDDLVSDSGLLAAAALVLRSRDFDVQTVQLVDSSVPVLLAEDPHFLVCVVEFAGPDQLTALESAATFGLAERLGGAHAKRWDAYLVLLTREVAPREHLSATVADILYNTRYVRRMIRWGVANTEESLTKALRPFIALPEQSRSLVVDPLQSLIDRLPMHGIDKAAAVEAISLWEASADVVDDD